MRKDTFLKNYSPLLVAKYLANQLLTKQCMPHYPSFIVTVLLPTPLIKIPFGPLPPLSQPNFRQLVHPLPIDFGWGSCCSCDRGKSRSTPSLKTWTKTGFYKKVCWYRHIILRFMLSG